MNAVDEISMACHGQSEPISVEEALSRETDGKILVHLSSTLRLAEIWFEATVSVLMSQGKIENVKQRRASLKQGGEIVAMTDYQVEHGGVRGLTPVWIA